MSSPEQDPRTILSATGKDRMKFLQGLVTNDVGLLAGGGAVWAALLTPQGKYLADFFMLARDGAILLDVPAPLAEDLARRLAFYRLRADVALAPADLAVRRGLGAMPPGAVPDPRHAAMGWRLYGAEAALPAEPAGAAWTALRVAHLVPAYPAELVPNESYVLECGFERLHGVDFRKGCYVGQEVTARMKHKTELRKGLVRLELERAVAAGTEVMAGARAIGRLTTVAGTGAIAYLRQDRAATSPLSVGGAAARIVAPDD